MTRACLTGWNSSTDDSRITSRRIPRRQFSATRIEMSCRQANGCRPLSRLGIGRRPPAPSGPIVADYVLGLVKDDGRHSWGMLGSWHTHGASRGASCSGRLRCAGSAAAPNETLPFALRLRGRISSASMRHSSRNTSRPAQIRPAAPISEYRLLLVEEVQDAISKRKDRYVGAWCYMHAQFYLYRGRHWRGGCGTSQHSSSFRGTCPENVSSAPRCLPACDCSPHG